ncbi:MAG: phosphoribosylanthranilate isomerase [Anaerolineae bacterium]|nr:phosphoribosylanthranilate isomerase [Anaerolineae bacterium]
MTIVKICGITRLEDALIAVEAGADMIGLNFYPRSKRYLAPERALEIRQTIGDRVLWIGVFVNESADQIRVIMDQVGLDYAQLSGDEPIETLAPLSKRAFKAIRPTEMRQALDETVCFHLDTDVRFPTLLLDAYHPGEYGGTGIQAADPIAVAIREKTTRLMLAGGLTPENVAQRIKAVRPWGVDVASGVENGIAGVKEAYKIHEFIRQAKEA